MADKNYYSIADQDYVDVFNKTLPETGVNPLDYSDILKLSHATNIHVAHCNIYGGKEDCIDMNRLCYNVTIDDTLLYPNGDYGVTIKGGTNSVHLKGVIFYRHGKNYDIDIGNWSDQSSELTTNVILENVRASDGGPVKVRVLWGNRPVVIGGNVKVTVIPKIFVKIYRWLRARKWVS